MHSSAQLLSMKGRCVLITGAAAGIGKAMALRFADAGADLVLLDIDEAGLAQAVDDLCGYPSKVITHVVDLTRKAQIDAFWQNLTVVVPDTLIKNAGSYPMLNYLEVDQGFLEKTMQVNLESALWMCQGFIARRKMGRGKKKGGSLSMSPR